MGRSHSGYHTRSAEPSRSMGTFRQHDFIDAVQVSLLRHHQCSERSDSAMQH